MFHLTSAELNTGVTIVIGLILVLFFVRFFDKKRNW